MLCGHPRYIRSGTLELDRPGSQTDEIRLELLPPELVHSIGMREYRMTARNRFRGPHNGSDRTSLRRCSCPRLNPSELLHSKSLTLGANVYQARGTGSLRGARGLASRDCASGMHVSSFYVYRRPRQFVTSPPGGGCPGCIHAISTSGAVCPVCSRAVSCSSPFGKGVRHAQKQDRHPGSVRRPRNDQYRVR